MMPCSIDLPCGKVIRVELETTTHTVLACLNGHHHVVGLVPTIVRPANARHIYLPKGPDDEEDDDDME